MTPDDLANTVDRERTRRQAEDFRVRVGDVARNAFRVDHAERTLRRQAEVRQEASGAFDRGRRHRGGARGRGVGDRFVTADRIERGVRDEAFDGQTGRQGELRCIASVGDGRGRVVIVTRERREGEQRMDARANEASGRCFTSGASGGTARVATITARKLEASDDDEGRRELDRAMCALREHRRIASHFERDADIASRERDFRAGETTVELVTRFGACVLSKLDGALALTRHRARRREKDGDLRRGRGVERGLTMKLFEARQRGVEAKLEQIDRGDDRTTASRKVTELATNTRSECGGGKLGRERGLTTENLEVGEIELGAQRS